MYQRVILCGNLGRDPELRHTPNGDPVCNLNIAVNRRYKDKSGEYRSLTTWFRAVVWGAAAEACAKHLTKGQQVLVDGEMMEPKPYQAKNGEWRANLDVRVGSIVWGKSLRNREEDDARDDYGDDEEDIPF